MKRKLFIIILIGLCLNLTKTYSQLIKGTGISKVSVADNNPPSGSSCLDKYLSFCDQLWGAMSVSITYCNETFANNPDGNIECNTFATDLYLNVHGVADAMYDRCKAEQQN